jgi:hypothetical protein
MIIQNALLPHKHVRFCDSILALAGYLRQLLVEPRTIDELWTLVDRDNSGWPARPSFSHIVLAVDVLFAIGQVKVYQGCRIQALER